jgi:hypothetical protein
LGLTSSSEPRRISRRRRPMLIPLSLPAADQLEPSINADGQDHATSPPSSPHEHGQDAVHVPSSKRAPPQRIARPPPDERKGGAAFDSADDAFTIKDPTPTVRAANVQQSVTIQTQYIYCTIARPTPTTRLFYARRSFHREHVALQPSSDIASSTETPKAYRQEFAHLRQHLVPGSKVPYSTVWYVSTLHRSRCPSPPTWCWLCQQAPIIISSAPKSACITCEKCEGALTECFVSVLHGVVCIHRRPTL